MNSPTGPRNVPSTPTPTPVLWCDLDGTIRHGKDELGVFANSADQVVIFDGVREILAKYRAAGWRIMGVTNQGGIAMGHLTVADCHAMCARTDELCGYVFDFIMFAEDHPDSPNPMWRSTWNRKPAIGMLVQGEGRLRERYEASEYYPAELGLFIGDRREDSECAFNAGIRFQWAGEWRGGGWEKWLEKS